MGYSRHGDGSHIAGVGKKLVSDVQDKVRNVDLMLFCINMTSARFRQGDNQNLRIITKAFGESIWKNAIFVLTFANQVKPPPSRNGTPPREYFEERLQEWKRKGMAFPIQLRKQSRSFRRVIVRNIHCQVSSIGTMTFGAHANKYLKRSALYYSKSVWKTWGLKKLDQTRRQVIY